MNKSRSKLKASTCISRDDPIGLVGDVLVCVILLNMAINMLVHMLSNV